MFIIDFIVFLIVLGVVVFVHELGHFVAAKTSGVGVEEFGLGFPPRIYKKKIGETQYFIGAIPFGGMTRIYGMDEDDPNKDKDSKAYENKSVWKKLWICAGGIIFNLLFAVVVFYGLVMSSGFKSEQALIFSGYRFPFGSQTNEITIGQVSAGSPAEEAGLKTYDVVISVNGVVQKSLEEFQQTILDNKGREVDLKMKDGRDVLVTPRVDYSAEEGSLGVGLREVAILNYSSVPEKVFVGFLHTYNITHYSLVAMWDLISYSVVHNSAKTLAYSMTGPVGIFAITKITIARGLYDTINLIAILSIALGVSNLLPIPAMDGAKLLYIGLQSFNNKIFSKELQMKVEAFGAFFLIALALFIVFKDFIQFKDIIFK